MSGKFSQGRPRMLTRDMAAVANLSSTEMKQRAERLSSIAVDYTVRRTSHRTNSWTEPSTRRISGSQMNSLVGDKSDPLCETVETSCILNIMYRVFLRSTPYIVCTLSCCTSYFALAVACFVLLFFCVIPYTPCACNYIVITMGGQHR